MGEERFSELPLAVEKQRIELWKFPTEAEFSAAFAAVAPVFAKATEQINAAFAHLHVPLENRNKRRGLPLERGVREWRLREKRRLKDGRR